MMKLFLASSSKHLRPSLVKQGRAIGDYETYTFADQERGYRLKEDVQGKSIALIASILPAPESLFELLALYRLIVENGAAETVLIVPYLGYARQDRPLRKGEAGIGLMVAEILKHLQASQLILWDLHSEPIRRAFGPSLMELSALPLFASLLADRPPEVIVAPDTGSIPRAEKLAKLLTPHPGIALVDKVRPRPNVAMARRLSGDVQGKEVLIIDDMIDTGGTLAEAVKLVSEKGASAIRLAATHGIFSGQARECLSRLPISEILITNTLPQIRYPKIRRLDIVPLLLAALPRL